MRKEEKNREQEHRIGIKGWGSLFLLIILFSGIFTNSGNFLKAFDLSNLIGSFGIIADGLNFEGQGGVGARALLWGKDHQGSRGRGAGAASFTMG